MTDEDFNCSSVCTGNVQSPSRPSAATPGLTSPPYVATPFDHDYAKRKTLRRQQWQQQRHEEQQADGTVPVLGTVSGVGLSALSALGQEAHWGVLRLLITMLNGFGFSYYDPYALGDWDVVKWAIWLLIISLFSLPDKTAVLKRMIECVFVRVSVCALKKPFLVAALFLVLFSLLTNHLASPNILQFCFVTTSLSL